MDKNLQQVRRKNFFISILFMLAIFGIYIVTASRAPYSDNIGILVVPPIIFIFYGPFISLILAWFKAARQANFRDVFSNFSDLVFARMPRTFLVTGIFGLILLVLSALSCGSCVFSILLFPFWAVFV